MYDAVIIGSGPAGISAALTLKLHKKDFLLLGSKNLSDKISRAEKIANYPGLPMVSGAEFFAALKTQLSQAGIEVTEAVASSVQDFGQSFGINCGKDFYEAANVIIASGAGASAQLPGEEKLLGRGVSYCATCDGFLYSGKTLFVVSESEELAHEVEYLAGLAEKVYLYAKYPVHDLAANIEIAGKPLEIAGDERADRVITENGEYNCDGVFLLKSSFAPSALVPGVEVQNGSIRVARDMSTSIAGVFAAGDVTGRPMQYAKAVGEGNVAAHSVIERLAAKK